MSTAARAAAEWWAEQVGAPVHRLVTEEQRDFSSDFAELGMLIVAARNPVPDGAGDAFAADLEKLVDELLERRDGRVTLSVDYGPDPELGDTAEAHGIHGSRFPVKSCMWVYRDHVVVSLGYRGRDRLIWQAPDWDRPTCHSLEYDKETQRFGDQRCTLPRFHEGGHGNWQPDPCRCRGCGLTRGGHYNRTADGDYHTFEERS